MSAHDDVRAGVAIVVGICEDDPLIRRVLVEALSRAGCTTLVTHTGGEALRVLGPPVRLDVIVLDIGLPDSDGRDVCQALRVAGQHAPVIFLTARDGVTDVVSGFSAGGDDYLTKPFAVAELVARVSALARRREGAPPASGLVLDPNRLSLRHGAVEVDLSPTEFRLLAALAERPGDVVRRRRLVAAGWPHGAMVQENTIDSYVRRLRSKLESLGAPHSIDTVRGIGYVLR